MSATSTPNWHEQSACAARLGSAIAEDASVLLGLLHEFICDGEPENTADRLHAYAMLVSRIGLMADRIAVAGGLGRHRDPSMWILWNETDTRAFDYLGLEVCK